MPKFTEEQQRAIDLEGENILVSAGAGSGKTAVLSERVLRKVMGGVPVNQLLILTFTKKAASEMKERIRKKLRKANLTRQLELLDSSFITTFDAYSMAIVKKYADNLNISSNLEVMDDVILSLKEDEIIDEIFKEYYDKKDINFYKFLDAFTFKDDKEIKTKIKKMVASLDLVLDLDDYLDSYLDNYYKEENLNGYLKEYLKLIMEKDNYLKKLINDFLGMIDDKYYNKVIDITSNYLASTDYSEIREDLNFKIPNLPKGSEEDVKNLKKEINSKQAELLELMVYPKEEDYITSLKNTYPYVSMLLEIIKKLRTRIWEYKTKENAYTFLDIEKLAIKLVKEFEEVREELKNSYQEILIDEYQDTNDIQETFISYIAKNNVYMVGDIKQSIYRFRNANPMLFQEKYDNYKVHNGGTVIDLSKNFRSRREVINTINDLFCHIMDQEIGGANYLDGHAMIFGNLTYENKAYVEDNCDMEILSYSTEDKEYETREKEAFLIASDIKNKIINGYPIFGKDTKGIRKAKYSDFAILLDSSKSFELYKKILEYNDIPTSIVKSVNLTDGEVITIIKNIIGFIIKIKDNVIDNEFKKLFISIARSFLFNLDDNIIFDYFLNNNFKDSDIYKISYGITKDLDAISLDEIIDIIIDKYDFYNKLFLLGDYSSNIIRIDKLKEITSNLTNLDYDIYKYSEYLENIIESDMKIEYNVTESSNNTVKIMTIHASKGLEFSVCYYGGLYSKFNIREAISKFSYDDKYGIIIPYKDKFLYNTIYHNLSYRNYVLENISERIRLFYVALTRAKEKMIFILPENTKEEAGYISDIIDDSIRSKYNSFASIMYSLESITKSYYKNIDINSIDLSKNYNLVKNDNYNKLLGRVEDKLDVQDINIDIQKEEEKSFSKKNIHITSKEEQDRLDYGKKVHELFELTDFHNTSNLTGKNREIITNFLDKVNIDNADIYKEYEFIYEEDNTTYHGIIDLMLVYKDNIKIIDYKLKNISDEAYLKQLNGYKDYIENRFNKPTNIYLYSVTNNTLEKI